MLRQRLSTYIIELTILFTALKLLDIVNIPWIWVFSPVWISILIVLILGIVFGIEFE